jgi:hypothetical protein
VVSFTPRPLYRRGTSPLCPLARRLGGPQSRCGRVGEISFLCRESNPGIPARRYTDWARKLYNLTWLIDGRGGPGVWNGTWAYQYETCVLQVASLPDSWYTNLSCRLQRRARLGWSGVDICLVVSVFLYGMKDHRCRRDPDFRMPEYVLWTFGGTPVCPEWESNSWSQGRMQSRLRLVFHECFWRVFVVWLWAQRHLSHWFVMSLTETKGLQEILGRQYAGKWITYQE